MKQQQQQQHAWPGAPGAAPSADMGAAAANAPSPSPYSPPPHAHAHAHAHHAPDSATHNLLPLVGLPPVPHPAAAHAAPAPDPTDAHAPPPSGRRRRVWRPDQGHAPPPPPPAAPIPPPHSPPHGDPLPGLPDYHHLPPPPHGPSMGNGHAPAPWPALRGGASGSSAPARALPASSHTTTMRPHDRPTMLPSSSGGGGNKRRGKAPRITASPASKAPRAGPASPTAASSPRPRKGKVPRAAPSKVPRTPASKVPRSSSSASNLPLEGPVPANPESDPTSPEDDAPPPDPILLLPREEQPYTLYFPDLDVTAALDVVVKPAAPVPPSVPLDSTRGSTASPRRTRATSTSPRRASAAPVSTLSFPPPPAPPSAVESVGSVASSLLQSAKRLFFGSQDAVTEDEVPIFAREPLSFPLGDGSAGATDGATAENSHPPRPPAPGTGKWPPTSFPMGPTKPIPVAEFEELSEPADDEDRDEPMLDDADAAAVRYLPRQPSFSLPESTYLTYHDSDHVEYDMDDRDRQWTDAHQIGHDLFEVVMDTLEKEWHHLTAHLSQDAHATAGDHPDDDGNCIICDDGECENVNAIVWCDGCNIAVHQECYGVPYIPEGQWLCRRCMHPDSPAICVLCGQSEGALKRTTDHRWAHVLCALWIPEVTIANTAYMEPIDVSEVPEERTALVCALCKRKTGACIQCVHPKCYAAFHVSCARNHGLYMQHDRVYCEKHLPPSYRRKKRRRRRVSHLPDLPLEAPVADGIDSAPGEIGGLATAELGEAGATAIASGSNPGAGALIPSPRVRHKSKAGSVARNSKASTNKSEPHPYDYVQTKPVVPAYVFKRLAARFPTVAHDLLVRMCRYWAIKRQSRGGTALLRRLALDPHPPPATEAKRRCLELIRYDLERVRSMCDDVRRRERLKVQALAQWSAAWTVAMSPLAPVLTKALNAIRALDVKRIFHEPVDSEEVSDYLTLVARPMDFRTMQRKIDLMLYDSVDAFKADLELTWTNCETFNPPDTIYHRAAVHMRASSAPVLRDLDAAVASTLVLPEFPAELWPQKFVFEDEIAATRLATEAARAKAAAAFATVPAEPIAAAPRSRKGKGKGNDVKDTKSRRKSARISGEEVPPPEPVDEPMDVDVPADLEPGAVAANGDPVPAATDKPADPPAAAASPKSEELLLVSDGPQFAVGQAIWCRINELWVPCEVLALDPRYHRATEPVPAAARSHRFSARSEHVYVRVCYHGQDTQPCVWVLNRRSDPLGEDPDVDGRKLDLMYEWRGGPVMFQAARDAYPELAAKHGVEPGAIAAAMAKCDELREERQQRKMQQKLREKERKAKKRSRKGPAVQEDGAAQADGDEVDDETKEGDGADLAVDHDEDGGADAHPKAADGVADGDAQSESDDRPGLKPVSTEKVGTNHVKSRRKLRSNAASTSATKSADATSAPARSRSPGSDRATSHEDNGVVFLADSPKVQPVADSADHAEGLPFGFFIGLHPDPPISLDETADNTIILSPTIRFADKPQVPEVEGKEVCMSEASDAEDDGSDHDEDQALKSPVGVRTRSARQSTPPIKRMAPDDEDEDDSDAPRNTRATKVRKTAQRGRGRGRGRRAPLQQESQLRLTDLGFRRRTRSQAVLDGDDEISSSAAVSEASNDDDNDEEIEIAPESTDASPAPSDTELHDHVPASHSASDTSDLSDVESPSASPARKSVAAIKAGPTTPPRTHTRSRPKDPTAAAAATPVGPIRRSSTRRLVIGSDSVPLGDEFVLIVEAAAKAAAAEHSLSASTASTRAPSAPESENESEREGEREANEEDASEAAEDASESDEEDVVVDVDGDGAEKDEAEKDVDGMQVDPVEDEMNVDPVDDESDLDSLSSLSDIDD
ncbi:Bromodomain and PHD finger-containing protein 1 [Allomyces arbusculus]|nr:Bromodomain and PHD finger-containing protein 1 [Allomyces arbusculus]